MPEIEIRPANSSDIPELVKIDHDYVSDYVWQLEVQRGEEEINIAFREVHLPRSVHVAYPREPHTLIKEWKNRAGLLIATMGGNIVGYVILLLEITPRTTWVSDLVVVRKFRRQGIGSGLVLAAQEWARQHHTKRIVLEMQPKNYPAIRMAKKLGFELCGYNDRYYLDSDIALFFARSI